MSALAIERFDPGQAPAAIDTATEVARAVAEAVALAEQFQVSDQDEAQQAATFLTRLAREKKALDAARVALVKPHRDYVSSVNDQFKAPAAALDAADQVVRGRVLDFQREQERRRREEELRLAREREEAERAAREERERAEAEAAAATERQRTKAAEAATELEREIAALDDAHLIDEMLGADEARADAARREGARRRAAWETEEAAERARRAEEAARSAPSPSMPAVARLRGEGGGAIATRTRWEGVVVDESAVPREYLSVDQKKINAAVRGGVRAIAGVNITPVQGLAVSAR